MTLNVLRSTGQEFCRISLDWGLPDVFLMIRLWLRVSGRKITGKVLFSSDHVKDACYQHDLLLMMLTLITGLR